MFDRKSPKLFDYPLPKPKNTQYDKLGITPEATAGEIREAKQEAVERINKQKAAVDREINLIYETLPELKATYDNIKKLHSEGEKSDPKALAKAEKELPELEKKAEAMNPNFKELRNRSSELEQKIFELNRLKLENPEERLEYDKSTPPCALLKLENCDQEIFFNNKLALFLLRTEVVQFLSDKGEICYHPSDLTREDFYMDFTYNVIIDGAPHDISKTRR